MNWQDTTDKHFGANANGRRAVKLESNGKSSSVRSNAAGGYLLITADGLNGKSSDMYTVEVRSRQVFETWDEAITAGEAWIA